MLGLLDCYAENAHRCGERLRETMERLSVAAANGDAPIRLTIRVGVASRDEETPDTAAFSNDADPAMYGEKRAGRSWGRPAS